MPIETLGIVKAQEAAKIRHEKLQALRARKAELKAMLAESNTKVSSLKSELHEKRNFKLSEASEKVINAQKR